MTPTKREREAKLRQAVDLLNEIVKIRLAPSPVHGIGVFAMRDIKKGEKLYTDIIPHQFDVPFSMFKKFSADIREVLLGHFPQIVNGSHFLYPVCKMSAYLNHSTEPNYDAKEDKALRKIKAGEEILEDYRLIPGYEQVFPFLAK